MIKTWLELKDGEIIYPVSGTKAMPQAPSPYAAPPAPRSYTATAAPRLSSKEYGLTKSTGKKILEFVKMTLLIAFLAGCVAFSLIGILYAADKLPDGLRSVVSETITKFREAMPSVFYD